jgi:anti-sigma-K factor RskA
MLTGKISSGGTATVVMSHREHALVFTAHGLRALPAAKCYQLWLMGPHGIRSVGMLKAAAGGMTGPAVVSGLAAGDVVGLTIEPTGGSPQPTSPPIVLIGRG